MLSVGMLSNINDPHNGKVSVQTQWFGIQSHSAALPVTNVSTQTASMQSVRSCFWCVGEGGVDLQRTEHRLAGTSGRDQRVSNTQYGVQLWCCRLVNNAIAHLDQICGQFVNFTMQEAQKQPNCCFLCPEVQASYDQGVELKWDNSRVLLKNSS